MVLGSPVGLLLWFFFLALDIAANCTGGVLLPYIYGHLFLLSSRVLGWVKRLEIRPSTAKFLCKPSYSHHLSSAHVAHITLSGKRHQQTDFKFVSHVSYACKSMSSVTILQHHLSVSHLLQKIVDGARCVPRASVRSKTTRYNHMCVLLSGRNIPVPKKPFVTAYEFVLAECAQVLLSLLFWT